MASPPFSFITSGEAEPYISMYHFLNKELAMKTLVSVIFATLTASQLSGCVAVPFAMLAVSGVGLYNVTNPEKNVKIDMGPSDLERMKTQLMNVNHLAILANNTAAVSFSDVWENAGKQASIITSEGDPSAISLSQAKKVLTVACKPGIHASTYGRLGDIDVNRLAMIIGKAPATVNADLYIYNCKTKKLESSPFVIAFNAMGQDGNQADRSVGAGLASKLLEIAQN